MEGIVEGEVGNTQKKRENRVSLPFRRLSGCWIFFSFWISFFLLFFSFCLFVCASLSLSRSSLLFSSLLFSFFGGRTKRFGLRENSLLKKEDNTDPILFFKIGFLTLNIRMGVSFLSSSSLSLVFSSSARFDHTNAKSLKNDSSAL